jgi:hypothetical protein
LSGEKRGEPVIEPKEKYGCRIEGRADPDPWVFVIPPLIRRWIGARVDHDAKSRGARLQGGANRLELLGRQQNGLSEGHHEFNVEQPELIKRNLHDEIREYSDHTHVLGFPDEPDLSLVREIEMTTRGMRYRREPGPGHYGVERIPEDSLLPSARGCRPASVNLS